MRRLFSGPVVAQSDYLKTGRNEIAKTHRTHEAATVEMFHRDPELAAEYLNSVLADEFDLMLVLRSLSSAFGGVQEVLAKVATLAIMRA